MNNINILFSEIKPFVRYSRLQAGNLFFNYKRPYDNRIFYCLSGTGSVRIEDRDYFVKKDTVILWHSGMKYLYIPKIDEPFVFDAINFDFTFKNSKANSPIEPIDVFLSDKNDYLKENISDVTKFNDVIVLDNALFLKDSFEKLRMEFTAKRIFYESKCSAILLGILSELARTLVSDMSEKKANDVDEMLMYIQRNSFRNITNEEISQRFGYHKNYINSLITSRTGISLHKYGLMCRINKAIELLHETDLNIEEISQKCGFSSAEYFSRYFKKTTGYSPGTIRKNNRRF